MVTGVPINGVILAISRPSFTGNGFDQRGSGFPRVVNGRVDIGAYEAALVVLFTG